MNKDKVYLKGCVIGRAVDTLGYEGLMVQLENLDVVEIDKNLVHRDINGPQKVTVPQSVANYIEYTKVNEWDLLEAMENIAYEDDKDLRKWFNNNSENFALAWINGCEVEEEKLYKVKTKGTVGSNSYLNLDMDNYEYFWGSGHTISGYKTKFTKAELEKAGFGEVFTCSIFDVGEVEE